MQATIFVHTRYNLSYIYVTFYSNLLITFDSCVHVCALRNSIVKFTFSGTMSEKLSLLHSLGRFFYIYFTRVFFLHTRLLLGAAGADHIDLHGDLKVIDQVNTVWQGKYNSIINNLSQTMNSLIRPEGTWSKCCVDNITHNNQDEDKISNRVYWPRIYLCVCIRVSNSQARNIILLWRNIHPEYPYFNHAFYETLSQSSRTRVNGRRDFLNTQLVFAINLNRSDFSL